MTQVVLDYETIAPQRSLSRKSYLDAIRATAIVAVVVIHLSSSGLDAHASRSAWWAANFFDAASRWAVPVFVMISGALLLDPSREETPGQFYRRRLLRIGVPLLFWSAFYLCWRRFFHQEHLSARTIFRLMARGNPYFHLYFLFLITGLYMVTPMLRTFIRAESRERQLGAALIGLGWTASVAMLNLILQQHNEALALTMFTSFVGYYLMGHVIASNALPSTWYRAALPVFIATVALATAGTGVSRIFGKLDRGRELFYGYTSPVVMLLAISLFAAFVHHSRRATSVDRPLPLIVRRLSSASFGIYLFHPVILDLLGRLHISLLAPHAIIAIPFWTCVILGISLLAVQGARKVPPLRAVF